MAQFKDTLDRLRKSKKQLEDFNLELETKNRAILSGISDSLKFENSSLSIISSEINGRCINNKVYIGFPDDLSKVSGDYEISLCKFESGYVIYLNGLDSQKPEQDSQTILDSFFSLLYMSVDYPDSSHIEE